MQQTMTQEKIDFLTSQDEEAQQVHAARTDPQAFGQLYDRYAPSIYRYLLSRLGNVEEAKDVTSQTFLTAFEAFPRYQHHGYFSAWLFSIARSKYIDFLRKARNHPDPLAEEVQANRDDPLMHVIETERACELRKCIGALPGEEQELLRLRYVAGLSFAEVAALLKKKEDAVKKSVYRLLARLQSQLEA
jgi:RNA polymerase sigma-70 factor (ECF subfamily)